MALKTYTPVTSTTRHLVTVDRSELYKGAPVKTLTSGKKAPAVAIITDISPADIVVADTNNLIVLSILNVIRWMFRQQLNA